MNMVIGAAQAYLWYVKQDDCHVKQDNGAYNASAIEQGDVAKWS